MISTHRLFRSTISASDSVVSVTVVLNPLGFVSGTPTSGGFVFSEPIPFSLPDCAFKKEDSVGTRGRWSKKVKDSLKLSRLFARSVILNNEE